MTATIAPAAGARDLDVVRVLIREYATAFDRCHCFDGLEEELAALPGECAPPGGCLLLAREGGRPVGCVALRPLGDGACELRRLYVVPAARGAGLGRALSRAALERARADGHRVVRLETLEEMTEARALYRELGFVEARGGPCERPAAVHVMERALA